MSFGDTANSPAGVIALGAVMLLLSTLAVIGRVAARSMRKVQLAWDDYTIFIAWVWFDLKSTSIDHHLFVITAIYISPSRWYLDR